MLQSIIVYSLLIVIMITCARHASKMGSYYTTLAGVVKKRTFWRYEVIFPLLLFAVIFGMRYDVGVDYLNYLYGYLDKNYVGKDDPLFFLLSDIGWKLNIHYVIYFSTISLIQVFFFFYAFKDERFLFPFLVFFLFTNGDWLFWMNGIRQALAMCIWLYSIKYIENKKKWKYLLWGIAAFLFHRSAIVLIIFYPILKNGRDYFYSIPLQLILLTGAFIFKEIFNEVILRFEPIINSYSSILGNDSYSIYNMDKILDSFRKSEGTGLAYLFKIILNIIIILYSKKIKSFYNSKRFRILYFFFFIGLITLYMFPVGAITITRPFRYFYLFQTIMYAYFLYFLYKSKIKNTRQGTTHALMYYGLIIIFLGIFYLSQITSNEDAHLWYQFYFDQNIHGYPN